ncbi:MAG: hypothetical protein IPO18_08925 [bacterium]|nr:hypothetical protein [bacterium]
MAAADRFGGSGLARNGNVLAVSGSTDHRRQRTQRHRGGAVLPAASVVVHLEPAQRNLF